ncbi:hypothetical protein FRB98_004602 [Tulasnella sp. 332]|nr:hypothetical protein FRB98_004602 [Tulasnella sp. 332]
MASLSAQKCIPSLLLLFVLLISFDVSIASARPGRYARGYDPSVRRRIENSPSLTMEGHILWVDSIRQRLSENTPEQSLGAVYKEDIPLEKVLEGRKWTAMAWSRIQQLIYPSGIARYDQHTSDALHDAVRRFHTERKIYFARQLMMHGMTYYQREAFANIAGPYAPHAPDEDIRFWTNMEIIKSFNLDLQPSVQEEVAGLFLVAACIPGRKVDGDVNYLTGGQLTWLQERLIVEVDQTRLMVLDPADIDAAKELPEDLKDTIRGILPYINNPLLDTILKEVPEDRVSTVSTKPLESGDPPRGRKGRLAPKVASGGHRLFGTVNGDMDVSIQ